MSLVADGPLIQVCGRAGSSRDTASGTPPTTWSARTTQHVQVGHERQRAAALAGAVVEDHGAGLRDADGGRGHDRLDVVELERRVNPSSTAPSGTSHGRSGGTTARAPSRATAIRSGTSSAAHRTTTAR